MPERASLADPGLLTSIADQLSLPGHAVRNLLAGKIGSAGKNIADFALNIPDAILPGDWIPEISGDDDRTSTRELMKSLGADLPTGFSGDVLSFLGDVATDPITYIPGAQLAKGAGMVGRGVKAITPKVVQEGVAKVAKPIGKKIKKVFGAEKIGKPLANVQTAAQGAREVAARSSSDAIVEGLKGSSPRELEAARDVLTNITRDKATKAARAIDETETLSIQDRLARYVMDNPDVDADRLTKIVNTSLDVGKGQFDSGASSGAGGNIFTDAAGQPKSDVVLGAVSKTGPTGGVKNYYPLMYKDDTAEELADFFGGAATPNPLKKRVFETAKERADWLNANPNLELADLAESMAKRGASQGEMGYRAATGKGLLEMAKAGDMALPDELLAKALPLAKSAVPKTVVTDGGGDLSRMLGGDISRNEVDLLNPAGWQSGKSVVPATGEILELPPDPYGIGQFSGTAKPPVSAVDEVPRSPLDAYGIGTQSGVSKPPVTEAIQDASEASLNAYGVGLQTGKARPPVTGDIAERVADPYGVGAQSGAAKPPVTGAIPERSRSAALVGEQSGISKAPATGEFAERGVNAAFVGEQSGKATVGKSTALPTGMTEAERKQAREYLFSKEFKLADPLMRETAEAIAKALPGDEADVALHMLKGMEARTGLPRLLATVNRQFKPVAVYGAIVPKLGSITRNMTGGVWQKYSNPEARGTISPKNIIPFMRDWLASIDDGVERLFGKRIFTKNEFAEMDAAFKAGGGDPRKALDLIKDPTMRAAAERGIFGNNFIDTEQLIAQSQRTGLREAGARLWDYPGHMFKGAEQRMRYGLFKQLTTGKNAVSADDAARIVRDSFYDYTISSKENRLARDIIPFFQFLGKSIPQQGKLMAEKPWLASTVANAYSQSRDEPVMPYMEGKINIPIGEDELGNRQYISNLGLPFESLSVLPNLSANPLQAGRDIEQSIVGSMSPLLKMPYSYISGRDPMFGSMPGSYTKVAGRDLGEAGGAINQLFSTGAGPAVAAQQLAGKVGQFTDERTSLGDLALNQLTGMRVQSVDEDRALQQRVQSLLERDPTIGQFRKFYSKDGNDTSADALLEALQNAKQSLKAKREALVPVN